MEREEIKSLREGLGLNQVEFAQLTGVHPITVSKWERGAASPTSYQNALFNQFREAAKNRQVRDTLKDILIGAGVAIALALLLKHLIRRK